MSLEGAILHEVGGEKAGSLGRAGLKVEAMLAELQSFRGPQAERDSRVKAAAEAVYHLFIQRELCGFPDHEDAIRLYAIPREVLARLGGA